MIDQKELHIGCWYNFDNPLCGEKTPRPFLIWTEAIDFEAYAEPIPISEEWLERLGFERAIENAGKLPCWKLGDITIARWANEKWQAWFGTRDIRKSPQNIHSLQNLISALTGKELTIKDLINENNQKD